MVLAIFVLGLLGTGGELLFLDHTHGWNQLIPIVLMVMSVLVLVWHGLDRKSASLRTFQITMVLLVAAGILGTGLHYQANEEFELEGDPTMRGMALLSKAMTGAAPALAPGAMIQLGLLGLVYTFRHPALERHQRRNHESFKGTTVIGRTGRCACTPAALRLGKSQGLLDANRATQQELMTVPNLTADLVKAIMEKRPFANVTEFAAALDARADARLN